MSEYLHGAYSKINTAGTKDATSGRCAMVYVGTAPQNTVKGGSAYVNKPVLVENFAQARAIFGYSDDWSKFTLCEAMKVHLLDHGVGPLILINVLDYTKEAYKGLGMDSMPVTVKNGMAKVGYVDNMIVDSFKVTGKVEGTDYTLTNDIESQCVIIRETSSGSLGTSINVAYDNVDPAKVTAVTITGQSTDGKNTGLQAVKNIYQETGYIPSFLAAPGWSFDKDVHEAMAKVSQKVNNHWDMYMFTDLPITCTMETAATWKSTNGYYLENETVYFPMVDGTDGKHYHLSVLAAANLQEMMVEQDGIPYRTASNTAIPIVKSLYLGDANTGKVYDDSIINEKLNKNGICSAAYVGGRWALWGAHSANYNSSKDKTFVGNVETNRMMLYYISNDFQHRRWLDVDKAITKNEIASIVAQEQARLDALVKIGALIYGEVYYNADASAKADVLNGDYSFVFNITATPIAKSMTAVVQWTDRGFETYFD